MELDTVSAGIAQQLYQKSSIAAQGFEETNLPDSFFDAVVGNVPFGDFKVPDKRYDKHKFLIHDYFFAKSLDKLRPGGVMALITSKGTMDKENSAVRKYIAQRADLLGAIRLPNNTFKGNAGTEVVSDILILQKRDRIVDIEPDWVQLGTDENGILMNGNIVQTETTVTKTTLYITVSHLTVDEMADLYGFDAGQREYLAELLKDENNSLWAAVLYGIRYSDDQIVTVALSQVGNVGGEPYWSWYGFGSRVEWCACFVSWCADQCGYIDTGVVPKYAGCVNGVQWFKDRGQWIDGSAEPVPGMIIFFDWDNKGSSGPQDGQSDHTGIVQKVENGIVYTVEGNSGDSCRVNRYSVGHYEILGYGVPNY